MDHLEMLTPEEVKEFQDVVFRDYGVQVPYDEAAALAQRLILLVELIARRTPSEEAELARQESIGSDTADTSQTAVE